MALPSAHSHPTPAASDTPPHLPDGLENCATDRCIFGSFSNYKFLSPEFCTKGKVKNRDEPVALLHCPTTRGIININPSFWSGMLRWSGTGGRLARSPNPTHVHLHLPGWGAEQTRAWGRPEGHYRARASPPWSQCRTKMYCKRKPWRA